MRQLSAKDSHSAKDRTIKKNFKGLKDKLPTKVEPLAKPVKVTIRREHPCDEYGCHFVGQELHHLMRHKCAMHPGSLTKAEQKFYRDKSSDRVDCQYCGEERSRRRNKDHELICEYNLNRSIKVSADLPTK